MLAWEVSYVISSCLPACFLQLSFSPFFVSFLEKLSLECCNFSQSNVILHFLCFQLIYFQCLKLLCTININNLKITFYVMEHILTFLSFISYEMRCLYILCLCINFYFYIFAFYPNFHFGLRFPLLHLLFVTHQHYSYWHVGP